MVTRNISLSSASDLGEGLSALSEGKTLVDAAELSQRGIDVEGARDTRVFFVQAFDLVESAKGQLWIGLSTNNDDVVRNLKVAMALIATQVQALVTRELLYYQLRLEHERKNQMLQHVFEVESEERKRIAREIHDETAQMLASLLLIFETFPGPEDPDGQDQTLDLARDRVSQILDATDRLIRRLRPAVLDDLGLIEAIRTVAHNLLVSSGIAFDMAVSGEEIPLEKPVENALYRVFQEAATNVVRHSGADRVQVCFDITSERVVASFEDNGHGLDLSWLDDATARPRWGMLGMRERILQVEGNITFSTPSGGGLRIDVAVPLGRHEAAPQGSPEARTSDLADR